MASITPLLKDYESRDGRRQIVIRVEHAGRHRLIPVGYKIVEKYWTGKLVDSKYSDAAIINAAIAAKLSEIRRYFADCELRGLPVQLDLIGTGKTSYSFTEYLDHRAVQYEEKGKIVMRQKVERFAKELRLCFGRDQVLFEEMTADNLRKLENWQIEQGNGSNTRHKKFKFLGEYYTHAMEEGKAPSPNPFKKHKIQSRPVKKEKLTEAEIKALEDLQLSPGPVADALNLFLFSYYAKGARFENCIMLRREDISNGRIHFRTNKGNKYISVKVHARLQAILDLYPEGDYIFPYVKEEPEDPAEYLSVVGSRNVIANRNLKVAAALAEIDKPITFHMARHSFAFHLKKVTKNINIIQESLGHSDQKTTAIYLKALDDEVLDEEMDKLYGA